MERLRGGQRLLRAIHVPCDTVLPVCGHAAVGRRLCVVHIVARHWHAPGQSSHLPAYFLDPLGSSWQSTSVNQRRFNEGVLEVATSSSQHQSIREDARKRGLELAMQAHWKSVFQRGRFFLQGAQHGGAAPSGRTIVELQASVAHAHPLVRRSVGVCGYVERPCDVMPLRSRSQCAVLQCTL